MQSGAPRLCGWLTTALLCTACPASANGPIGDVPVFARIELLRPVASAIAIDGLGADWGAIPELPDPLGDAGGDASRDITGVAIAPLDDALLVRIRTAGTPSTYDLAFWLYVDFTGQQFLDLEIGLYLGFDDILWTYPASGPPTFQYWSDSTTVIENVVEVRIPYTQLAAVLPSEMADALSGSDARSFVRVTPFTRDYSQPGVPIVDYGAAVASFRLVQTPYALDTALPAAGRTDDGRARARRPLVSRSGRLRPRHARRLLGLRFLDRRQRAAPGRPAPGPESRRLHELRADGARFARGHGALAREREPRSAAAKRRLAGPRTSSISTRATTSRCSSRT